MNLRIFKTLEELNENLVEYVLKIGKAAINHKGRFDFVLTGGNSPKQLYKSLASAHKASLDWSKVFFFIGDERNVPAGHQDYNGSMAKEFLLNELAIADKQIFLIDTSLSPEKAAQDYKKKLDQHFNHGDLVFDLVLLGMGDDAHTASIFPFTDLVNNKDQGVASVWVDKLNAYRISFTAPLINKADHVAFLAFGQNKATALRHVIGDETKDFETYPAQLIHPDSGNLDWFIDEPAARLLIDDQLLNS